MDTTQSPTPDSVAPPGFPAPADGFAVPLMPGLAAPLGAPLRPLTTAEPTATDAAVRWRLRAASFDYLVVYALYLVFCLLVHWRANDPVHLLAATVAGVLYHFGFELRDGQTPGKRRYGIKVVDVDGGSPDAKAIALRSVLRLIDSLPMLYLSGLISMVRTGPERRQRIGDVAGRTKVIAVDGRAAARGTPGWLLPAATVFAVVVSAAVAFLALEVRNSALSPTQQAQFVQGCQVNAGSSLDCQCLLQQLEADGYDSLGSLDALLEQEYEAILTRQPSRMPKAILDAARICRR